MSDKVQITIKNKVGEKYADLQTKIVTPSKETQVITADEGYYGLREVIVGAQVVDGEEIKEMLTNGANATPSDIKLGKTAYVSGKLITGNFEISGTLDITEDGEYDVSDYANANVQTGTKLKEFFVFIKNIDYMFQKIGVDIVDFTGAFQADDFSEVESCVGMFYGLRKLKVVPPMNIGKCKNVSHMFYYCTALMDTEFLDMSNVEIGNRMFYGCNNYVTKAISLNTPKLKNANEMFYNCRTESLSVDMSNVETATNMLQYTFNLKELYLKNIRINLQIAGSSFGSDNISLKSLIGLCQQCVNVGESRTLTMGSVNIEKLSNVYVRLTDETDDENYPKLPFETCVYVDEGAMTISQYMILKNWTLA